MTETTAGQLPEEAVTERTKLPGGLHIHLTGNLDRRSPGAPPVVRIGNGGGPVGRRIGWKRHVVEFLERAPGERKVHSVDFALPRDGGGDDSWSYGVILRVTDAAAARAMATHFLLIAEKLDEKFPAPAAEPGGE